MVRFPIFRSTSTSNGRSSKKVKPFALGDKRCKLCLQEKLSILRSAPSLNTQTNENFGHCPHKKRFQLNHDNNAMSTDEVPIVDRNLTIY